MPFVGERGSASAGIAVQITTDQKAVDRAIKRLDRYQGRALQKRAQQAYLEGARLLVAPMRRASPPPRTGNLRKSITARPNRLRGNEMAAATVGPRHRVAPHRYLVIRGTRPHELTGVRRSGRFAVFPDGNVRAFAGFRHPGSRADPFVDRATDANRDRIQSFIRDRVLDLGETFASF